MKTPWGFGYNLKKGAVLLFLYHYRLQTYTTFLLLCQSIGKRLIFSIFVSFKYKVCILRFGEIA